MVSATLPGIMLYACLIIAHADAFAPRATAHKWKSVVATTSCGRHIRTTRPTASVPLLFEGAAWAVSPRALRSNLPQKAKSVPWDSTDDWRANLFSIPQSLVLRRISGHLLFNVLVAAALFALRGTSFLQGTLSSFSPIGHSLTGAFLGLLVTFRTNSAYARFWEARIVWGGIMNTCRSLAVGVSVWIKPRNPATAGRLVQALLEFPTATMHQCRADRPNAAGMPTDVCHQLQAGLRDSAEPTSWDRPMGLYEKMLTEQGRHVDKLIDFTGMLNRIIRTPIPLSYSRHTSRFLTLWCTTLPLAIGTSMGLLPTLAVVFTVSWLVLGIDSIGQLLEQPFSQPVGIGDGFDFGLPVETLASGVRDEIARIVSETPGSTVASPPTPAFEARESVVHASAPQMNGVHKN